jgi:DNA replication protein DnaC
LAQQSKARPSVHLTLQTLHPVHLPFGLPLTPFHTQGVVDRLPVPPDAPRERPQLTQPTTLGLHQPSFQPCRVPLTHQRQEHQLQRYLRQAQFPYTKRLEDFDFSVVPSISKTQVLALEQGAFLAQHENVLLIGPSGLGKTHLLIGLGRAACLRGSRVLFRTAAALANELEVAQQQLRLPKLLAQYRRHALIVVDEVGYLPFSQTAAELLFQFFSDRYERASGAVTSNLDFAHWTEVFGQERMTAALLDRLVHRSHILVLEGESFRFRQSLEHQQEQPVPARAAT